MVPPQDKINGSPTANVDAFQGGANFALILEICRYNVCREAPNAREPVEFYIPASAIRLFPETMDGNEWRTDWEDSALLANRYVQSTCDSGYTGAAASVLGNGSSAMMMLHNYHRHCSEFTPVFRASCPACIAINPDSQLGTDPQTPAVPYGLSASLICRTFCGYSISGDKSRSIQVTRGG
jgi:hypothetical protein